MLSRLLGRYKGAMGTGPTSETKAQCKGHANSKPLASQLSSSATTEGSNGVADPPRGPRCDLLAAKPLYAPSTSVETAHAPKNMVRHMAMTSTTTKVKGISRMVIALTLQRRSWAAVRSPPSRVDP